MYSKALAISPKTLDSWSRPNPGAFATDPLMAILQIAIEAAVLPNRFEIDEQTPHSRLDALMEQALAVMGSCDLTGEQTEQILAIVTAVAERVRGSILLFSSDSEK